MVLQAFSVLLLYIRCTGIDPADPGIFVKADNTPAHKSQNSNFVPGTCYTDDVVYRAYIIRILLSYSDVSVADNASAIDGGPYIRHGSGCCNAIGRFICGCLVIQDCRRDTQLEESNEQEEALFCSLCNAEV